MTLESQNLAIGLYTTLSHTYNKSCPIHATGLIYDTKFLRVDTIMLLFRCQFRIDHFLDFGAIQDIDRA